MTAPPSSGPTTALEELCRELGVEPAHESGGALHPAPTETVLAALRALGAPLERPEEAADALRTVRRAHLDRLVPPTVVSWTDQAASLPVTLPVESAVEGVEMELALEDGSRGSRAVGPAEIRWSEEWSLEARTYRTGRIPLPEGLPAGYHRARVHAAGAEGRASLIRAPRSVWSGGGGEGPGAAAPGAGDARRADGGGGGPTGGPAPGAGSRSRGGWGVFLPLHALRTGRGAGVGDLADLRALSEWTAGRGGTLVGTLPLYDTFLGEGPLFDPSPYAPVSRLFWNPLWIALDEAPGLEDAPGARALLEGGDVPRRLRELGDARTVDYRAAAAVRRGVLEALADAHRGDGPHGLGPPLDRWVREDPEVLAYARFRAALESTGEAWTRWEGAARGGDDGALDPPDGAVRYHVYGQWAMEEQLGRMAEDAPAGLYLDLPLGSHPGGFDQWRHQERFARDFSVGAPPDAFYEGGQDWGFPPLHPRRTREDGHRYRASCLAGAMAVAEVVRLDHVMGLHRLFWIPAGADARHGVYVRYPADELWAVLCLESHRHRCRVVGEDLGTVPPEVPRAMERHGARRMWVLPFEVAADGGGAAYRVNPPGPRSVASLDTHDLPPFAAFVEGTDIDARLQAGRLDDQEAREERAGRRAWRAALAALLREGSHLGEEGPEGGEPGGGHPKGGDSGGGDPDAAVLLRGALRFLASSEADLVMVTLEDLWLETAPQNVPGTPSTSNWTRRARLTLEDMRSDPEVRALLELVDRCR